jgi:hypothetical protein
LIKKSTQFSCNGLTSFGVNIKGENFCALPTGFAGDSRAYSRRCTSDDDVLIPQSVHLFPFYCKPGS